MLKKALFVVGILIVALNGYAQEDIFFIGNKIGVGARALGLGGAYTALADDYTALFYNPAGLGQIRRMEFNLGYSHTQAKTEATFYGVKNLSDNSFTRLNSLGFVLPVPTYQGSMVLAFGYNKPHDFDDYLKVSGLSQIGPGVENDSLNQVEKVWSEGSLNRWSLAGAIEVQKDFFLGLGIDLYSGQDDYNVRFEETDPFGLYVLTDNDQDYAYDYRLVERNITTDFSGIGFNIGALYRWQRAIRMGANITFPKTLKLKENYTSYDETHVINDEVGPYYDDQEGKFEYKIQEPYKINLGVALSQWLFTFTGDLEFQNWPQAKFKTDPPIYDVSKQDINLFIKENLRATSNIRLGAEIIVPFIRTRVRGGLAYLPSPYKKSEASTLEDFDRDKKYLSLGLGILLDKQIMLDLVLLHGWWKTETTDDLTETITTEDRKLNRLMGTLSLRF